MVIKPNGGKMIQTKNIFIVTLLVLIGLVSLVNAQAETLWTRRWTSASATGSDYVYGLDVDGSGNVYIAGSSNYLGTPCELLVVKYNASGDTVWTRTPVRTGDQVLRAVAVGSTGNVYATGYTMETGNGNYITVKYLPDGTQAWVRVYDHGAGGYDFARKLVLDAQENVYITGYAQTPTPRKAVYVTVKYDSAGNQLWAKQDSFGGASVFYPSDLALDNTGNPFIVSKTKNAGHGTDYAVAKYNPTNGDTFWVRTYNGVGDTNDEARAIAFDASNNVYITGASLNTNTGGIDYNIVTIKYDSLGNQQWVQSYNNPDTTGPDGGYWIKVDGSGNIYVYGTSYAPGGPGGDLILIKYNSSGSEVGRARYNGPGGYDLPLDKDGQRGMVLDAMGNVYIAGYTRQVGSTRTDFITIKFNPSCETLWTARYNYCDSTEQAYAIDIDNTGNVYVTGRSIGLGTYYDCATIKYRQLGGPTGYTITATAIDGGTITPSGAVIVYEGTDTTFAIVPDIGHHLDSLIIDGANHGADSTSYRFINVLTDHNITAYFSINTYIITATATTGGTIMPSGAITINYGDDTTFTITANPTYVLDSVLVDDVSVGAVTTYPFTDVQDNHTIHAMFTMTATPGWTQKESLPTQVAGKYTKDGGALVRVTGTKDADILYAFRGKSREFYSYNAGVWTWLQNDSIPNGLKPTDPTKINKKVVAKGASMCFNKNHTIYATKGNGTREFWAYDLAADSNKWVAKAFVPVPKGLKGGTSIIWFNDKVYLLAGNQKKTDLNNFFVYDPAGDTALGTPWTPLASLVLGPKTKVWKDGACITEVNGVIYAMKSNDKPNYFFSYDTGLKTWTELTADTIPPFDSLLTNSVGKLKKVYVKDGASMATDGSVIYATKGGGYNFVWKYAPGLGWTRSDSTPRLHKKSVIKTGGAMTYANGAVWLLKGNNSPEFWKYVPTEKSNFKTQMSKVIQTVNTQSPIINLQSQISISPNPMTKLTTIQYTVPISGKVTIKLYNADGRLIDILSDEYLNTGTYIMNLTTNNLAKGIYFLKYEAENNRAEQKLIIQ